MAAVDPHIAKKIKELKNRACQVEADSYLRRPALRPASNQGWANTRDYRVQLRKKA